MARLVQQVIPLDDGDQAPGLDEVADDDSLPLFGTQRPGFNITTMSNNFRRFNGRIGVVFKFQARVVRILAWRRASHTLSFLAVYTLVCLDPYLLALVPSVALLLGVLIPSFLARHPAPAEQQQPQAYYSPRGPPLAPPRTVKPARDLSRDFFHNMGDLQNSMEDFSVAHDHIVSVVVPATNFSDEAASSALFVVLVGAAALLSISAHLLPWRLLALTGGWALTCGGHPAVARQLSRARRAHLGEARAAAARSLWASWVRSDVILDEAPETREVEIFELQRLSFTPAGEWDPWVFSPSPYDPLSSLRIAGERPIGTSFFEDVLPPAA